jgi:predicted dehydrogenase
MATIAFVGCAHIHTPGFVKRLRERSGFPSSDVQVKYLWDPNPVRSEHTAQTLGQGEVVSNVKTIWKDPSIDGVVICSETDAHKKLVLAAAKAGKHMFVEKPLGLGSRDSLQMARAVGAAGVKFQTGYFSRSLAVYRFIRQEIEAGRFGTITRAQAWNCHSGALGDWFATKPNEPALDWRWMADPKRAGCGAFGDLGTHMLDILMWLLGDIEAVTAIIRPVINRYEGCDETGQAMIRFASGVTGSLTAGWVDVANPVTLMVAGTQAHASVINGQLFYACKEIPGADGKTPMELPEDMTLPHAFNLFIDALNGKDVPLVSVHEAAARVRVMEAMYTASRKGRWISL